MNDNHKTENQPARMWDDLPDWAIAQASREAASMTGFIAPNIAEGMRIRARELSAHGGDGGVAGDVLDAACRLFAHGVKKGHNDTVEGVYTDVFRCDITDYYREEVAEILEDWEFAALAGQADEDSERCESGQPECGPVEFHDVEGVPLCRVCWEGLLSDSSSEQELQP